MAKATSGVGWLAYRLALSAGMAAAAPVLMAKKGGHYRRTFSGRIGRGLGPSDGVERLWIHAVSVGEAAVATTLVRRLPGTLPVVLTTVTPTGQEQAQKALGDRADVAYLPFDLERPVRRFIERFRPRALVLVEGDYWPLALAHMAPRGRIAVVNGRMSDRAFRRQSKIGDLNQLFYRHVDRFGLQSEQDLRRLEQLGVPADRLSVTGNLKYDAAEPPRLEALEALVEATADGRPILVAGSTMDGEEEQVLAAHRRLTSEHGQEALLVLAPRHPERWPSVAALLDSDGRPYAQRSALDGPPSDRVEVLLLDSLGELAGLYRLAQSAFIGGTLVPTGGHNPLEPARFAVPTVVGGSMENFQDMAARFDGEKAWWRVDGSAGLGDAWHAILADPTTSREIGARAKALLDANRGALDRSLELIAPLIEDVHR
ncbi:MAG: 3-deoxy-D-manno-octulosonic acid transferase [Acidobacteriota bacterium]